MLLPWLTRDKDARVLKFSSKFLLITLTLLGSVNLLRNLSSFTLPSAYAADTKSKTKKGKIKPVKVAAKATPVPVKPTAIPVKPAASGTAAPATAKKNENPLNLFDQKGSKSPTYVKADLLTLFSKDRKFVYSGNVEVRQDDMTLVSDSMEGFYDEKNQIKTISMLKNVTITKGDTMKGSGERADYDQASDTVLLSENPEMQQNGSVLTADRIRIFLKENRSVAEGQVRVKLLKGGSSANLGDLTKK